MNRIDAENIRRDRSSRRMSWLWFSCLALLLLLPPVSFAQAHLWKYRPFRANDTDHSGGDHICDLRRDSNADGKPDRLGDYITVSGTVIVEPSTFETGGQLFWIREGRCGILIYGDRENLRLGDSITVRGWVRRSDNSCFFSEPELAALDDVFLEPWRMTLLSSHGYCEPLRVSPEGYAACPGDFGGNLVSLIRPVRLAGIVSSEGNKFAWASHGQDSLFIYLDGDTRCSATCGQCYLVTGVVARIRVPLVSAMASVRCIIPRQPADFVEVGCSTDCKPTSWGQVKSKYGR